MKKKQEVISKNYLEKIPLRNTALEWDKDSDGKVTLYIKNEGFMNKIAQKLFKKPKVSQVHLDEIGNFLWPLLEEDKDIIALGELVKEEFGEKAEPLYERLVKYFQILESYNFIQWK